MRLSRVCDGQIQPLNRCSAQGAGVNNGTIRHTKTDVAGSAGDIIAGELLPQQADGLQRNAGSLVVGPDREHERLEDDILFSPTLSYLHLKAKLA